jgi:hypothetical protein
VETHQCERWRDAFWRQVGFDRDDPAKPWLSDTAAAKEQRAASGGFVTSPLVYRWPKMMAVAEQLGGTDFLPFGRGGSALVTWPREGGNHWQDLDPAAAKKGVDPRSIEKGVGLGGHLDGYGPSNVDWTGGVMLKATALVEDVRSGQAAFHVWPGSHRLFHEYICTRPLEIDGGFYNTLLAEAPHLATSVLNNPGYAFFHGMVEPDSPPRAPVEFTGHAGDVILWDNRLVHSGSYNHTDRPRVAVFAGWCHRRLYVPSTGPPDITKRTDWTVLPPDHPIRSEQERYRAAYETDMWKYWSDEVRRVPDSRSRSQQNSAPAEVPRSDLPRL